MTTAALVHTLSFTLLVLVLSSSSYPPYLSRLRPGFHVSLLEPYKDPSDFHAHAELNSFELDPKDNAATQIDAILDSRKIGQRFDYLIHFRNSSPDEDTWTPLTDIPNIANELIN